MDTLQQVNAIKFAGTALKKGLKKNCILLILISSNAILKTRVSINVGFKAGNY